MALTRKFLTALGIEAEKVEEIITAHVETLEAIKSENAELKKKSEDFDNIQKQLNDAEGKIEQYKTGDFEAKYNKLKGEYETFKADIENKAIKTAKETAYKELLKAVGISDKRFDAILKVTDLNSVSVEDGQIKNAEKLKENIKAEWSDFIVSENEQGAKVPAPPSNNGGNTFENMSLADKMKYANENPDASEVKEWLNKK